MPRATTYRYTIVQSPLGPVMLAADDAGVRLLTLQVVRGRTPSGAADPGPGAAATAPGQGNGSAAGPGPDGADAEAAAGSTRPRPRKPRQVQEGWRRDDRGLRHEAEQLKAYFAGALQRFEMRLAPHGTPFQLRVWEALQSIPYGETISYGELARRIGQPSASRAVGAANGANPIGIVIPCHRVIGANGSLVGYGGGLGNKERLIAHERYHLERRAGAQGVPVGDPGRPEGREARA